MNAPVNPSALTIDGAPVREILKRVEPPHRRTYQRVRHSSRPAGEHSGGALTWRQCQSRIRAIRRWERAQDKRPRAKNRAVGWIGIEVYAFLARQAVHKRGRICDLALGSIAGILGVSRSAVIAALARLRDAGWIGWVRQFVWTGGEGVRGPQVEQAPNSYAIGAPERELARLKIPLDEDPPPSADLEAEANAHAKTRAEHAFGESPVGQAVDALGRLVAERESSNRSDSRVE